MEEINLTKDQLALLSNYICPMCYSAGSIVLGPEGGGSQNMTCSDCGTKYCYGGFFASILRDEK